MGSNTTSKEEHNTLTSAAIALCELKKQEKQINEKIEYYKKYIRQNTVVGQEIVDPQTGTLLLQIRAGQGRFNPDHAKQHLPQGVYSSILTMQPDKMLAKELLAPALYELCCTFTEPMVIIK